MTRMGEGEYVPSQLQQYIESEGELITRYPNCSAIPGNRLIAPLKPPEEGKMRNGQQTGNRVLCRQATVKLARVFQALHFRTYSASNTSKPELKMMRRKRPE